MVAALEQFAEKQSYRLVAAGHCLAQLAHRKLFQNTKASFARLWSETAVQCCSVKQQKQKHKGSSSSILFSKKQKSRMPAALKLLLESPAIGCKTKKRRSLALPSRIWHPKSYRCFLQVTESILTAGMDGFRQQC